MNRQDLNETERDNVNQKVMNEIVNNLWARGGAISHDKNNDILKVILHSELENGETQTTQDMFPVNPESPITLLFIAGNILGSTKETRPKNLTQALASLQDLNAELIGGLSQEEQQALYEKEFIAVPGHEWITKNDIFSKESESKVNLSQERAHA